MLKRLFIALAFVLLLVQPSFAKDPLHVVVDPWPPFGGEDLPNGGISLDVITAVLSQAGYEVVTSIVPWERALAGARSGTYDIVGNLFYLPELEVDLTYADPFYESEVRFLRRKGTAHQFTDLQSLRPYTIAVGAGYFYETAFDQADFLQKTVVTTVEQGVRMVAAGRIDLTLDSVDVLNYVIASEAPELSDTLEIMPNALALRAIHMAIRNDHPLREQVRDDFNRVLSEMRKDGSLDELLAKHRY